MSSFERRFFLKAALVGATGLLAGCFRPMLAQDSAASELLGRIALPSIKTRFDRELYKSLEARLGTPNDPVWRLEVRARLVEDNLAITPDDAITRKSLTARADYALTAIGDDRALMRDSVVTQSGYNSTASLYATRAVRRDVEDRLARDLGERISRRVLAEAGRLLPA